MVEIPGDLLENVISRLPVKSVLRLKCVSKQWINLINSPYFANLHQRRFGEGEVKIMGMRRHRTAITFYALDFDPVDDLKANARMLKLPPIPRNCTVKDVGSCNGLICLVLWGKRCVIFWNPTTHQYRKVELDGVAASRNECYGFGYDEKADEYKLVILHEGCPDDTKTMSPTDDGGGINMSCSIYCLKSNSWKAAGVHHMPAIPWQSVFAGGALHWLAKSSVYTIDIASEEWRPPVPLPSWAYPDLHYCRLGTMATSSGSLLTAICAHAITCFDVWGMTTKTGADDHNEPSWTKLYSYYDCGLTDDRILRMFPAGYERKGRQLIMDHNFGRELVKFYDVEKKTFEIVDVCPKLSGYPEAAFTCCQNLSRF